MTSIIPQPHPIHLKRLRAVALGGRFFVGEKLCPIVHLGDVRLERDLDFGEEAGAADFGAAQGEVVACVRAKFGVELGQQIAALDVAAHPLGDVAVKVGGGETLHQRVGERVVGVGRHPCARPVLVPLVVMQARGGPRHQHGKVLPDGGGKVQFGHVAPVTRFILLNHGLRHVAVAEGMIVVALEVGPQAMQHEVGRVITPGSLRLALLLVGLGLAEGRLPTEREDVIVKIGVRIGPGHIARF